MPIEGLDIDQLTGLAQQIDSDAATLHNLVNTLNGVMGGLIFTWTGPAAATFEQDWQNKTRPALLNAFNTLTNLHTHLVSNINAQTSASAADPAWTVGGLGAGASPSVGAAILTGAVAAGSAIWNSAQQTEGVTSPIDTVASLIPDASEDLPVLGATGDFDTGMAVVTAGVDGAKAGDALANHQYAAAGGDLVDGTADALKAGGPDDPVPYLLGVTLELGKEDYDLAGQIDWSQGVPNPLSGDNLSTIYAPALEAVPGEMVAPLMQAFF